MILEGKSVNNVFLFRLLLPPNEDPRVSESLVVQCLPFKTFRRFGNLGNRLFLYARLGLLSVVEVSAFPSSEVSKNSILTRSLSLPSIVNSSVYSTVPALEVKRY